MVNEVVQSSKKPVGITVISKLKHAGLRDVVLKVGSQAALAKLLKVSVTELGRWCNLSYCPPKEPTPSWSKQRIKKLEKQLFDLTGKLLDDLFPDSLRLNQTFLHSKKTIEATREIEASALECFAERYAKRMTVNPTLPLQIEEMKEQVSEYLAILKPREADILSRRYGLNGYDPQKQDEIADVYKVTGGRIQAIEAKAISKLQESKMFFKSTLEDKEDNLPTGNKSPLSAK